jgi:hypothetical protein
MTKYDDARLAAQGEEFFRIFQENGQTARSTALFLVNLAKAAQDAIDDCQYGGGLGKDAFKRVKTLVEGFTEYFGVDLDEYFFPQDHQTQDFEWMPHGHA